MTGGTAPASNAHTPFIVGTGRPVRNARASGGPSAHPPGAARASDSAFALSARATVSASGTGAAMARCSHPGRSPYDRPRMPDLAPAVETILTRSLAVSAGDEVLIIV